MYDSPASLQECCVDFICENIDAICEVQANPDEQNLRYSFKDPEIFFHEEVSQQVLETLSSRGRLNDSILTLFDSRSTRLQRVRINKAADVTTKQVVRLSYCTFGVKHGEYVSSLLSWELHELTWDVQK